MYLSFSMVTAVLIGFIFFLVRITGLELFPPVFTDDLIQVPSLTAGIKLLAVLLFGVRGAIGIFCGWVFCYLLANERTLLECFLIGLLSATVTYSGFRLWQWFFQINGSYQFLTARLLTYLILISASLTALMRYAFLAITTEGAPFLKVFSISFVGDVAGAFCLLYLIKVFLHLFRRAHD